MIGDADGRVNASADHTRLIASPTGGAQSPRAPPRNVHFMRGGGNQVPARECPGFAVRHVRFRDNIGERAQVLRRINLGREVGMYKRCRNILFLATLSCAVAVPAAGQTVASSHEPTITRGAAIPDFSGVWRHPSLPGFEPPASGPGPVVNKVRRRGPRQPGASNYDQLVGDYTNPILKPHAAAIVKKYGRALAQRHHLREPCQPVLARAHPFHLQALRFADAAGAASDHDDLQRR